MAEQVYLRVQEVAEELGVSVPYAYKLIRGLNQELKQKGFIVIDGRITADFSTKRCMQPVHRRRRTAMAAFKNKSNGTWYVQFRYTDWQGQRQQKCKRGFVTKREALEWEREFLMQKQADINMTFESFVALYEKDIKPKLKLNTWLTKQSIIQKKIMPYFKNQKLSEITAKHIIDWQTRCVS